ncbi:TetR/AcrR family transcriptional regulator [Streptomyces sp. NPDC051985]|uniref:TetR/AcrR family transcriptional regulator n=1 Tax=Streptomyces sp. NPDC051985 TaxID=3155807 RepID=UPI003422859B
MTKVTTACRSRFTPQREGALYEAILGLLRDVGYDALTMDAVAARSHVSKATLYRQWCGKADLVVRALRFTQRHSSSDFDTGSLRGDLHARVRSEEDHVREEHSALMRALFTAVHANPDLAEAFQEQLIKPEVTDIHHVVRRAVDRGEVLADNPAVAYVPHMFVGCLVARSLIDKQPPTQEFLLSYIDSVILPALGVSAV